MDLGQTDKVRPLIAAVRAMVRDEIMPLEEEYHAEVGRDGDRFKPTKRMVEILESLKAKARAKGLWNFWLTASDRGYGLTTVEYAYLAEEMGWSPLASEVFNCSAPDTGNMEVIERFGSPEQKARWLPDLLEGRARSAYLMTEPGVASSDATNIAMDARLDGDEWVLNGEKWWSSGAGDPRCSLYITMTLTDPGAAPHSRHSMLFVPAAAKGIEILRAMKVYGDDDAPHGHMHIRFRDVRVANKHAMILGRGRGFEIAQGRLGPGRIHHCMRAIGQAERALEAMCRRAAARSAFGQKLARLGANPDIIAEARMSIEMARLLCLKAAWAMDTQGVRAAAPLISQIKVIAPRIALDVIDQAVQMHGGAGVSQDFPLARMWTHVRTSAPRRRARRCAPAGDRQGRDETLHQRGGRAVIGVFPEDTSALDAWAKAHVEGWRGPSVVKKFPTGQSNPTYRIDAASGPYVLRRKPPGKLLKMAHMIEREFRVLKALEGVGYPAPRALALCEDEGVIGTAFYLMAFVDGRVLWNPALPELEREERAPIYDSMNEGLARLHSIDVAAAGLSDYGRPGGYFARQYQRWTDQYRASETARIEDMERLIAWLADKILADDGRVALAHGDWRIDNMIFDSNSPRLLAVLDWELSTLGHPFADLAYQCMQWRLPNERYRGLGGVDRAANGIPTEAEYVAAYCKRMGLESIPNWTFLVAFSFFRSIAIHQGVYKRSLDGNASNPELARQAGESMPFVAHVAWEGVEAAA